MAASAGAMFFESPRNIRRDAGIQTLVLALKNIDVIHRYFIYRRDA